MLIRRLKEQSYLCLHCLPRPVCLKTKDHYDNAVLIHDISHTVTVLIHDISHTVTVLIHDISHTVTVLIHDISHTVTVLIHDISHTVTVLIHDISHTVRSNLTEFGPSGNQFL